ncbi:hypothetical protein PIB30_068590 [Stylosanthes scabra]|uniref:Uncharacterized protein n=1 Tax=Stylosanthes scabra TaxID=79078 RepID=A0ABU6SPD2_9FABA|nr:hypothetical protein [Stylosanthes scabra]
MVVGSTKFLAYVYASTPLYVPPKYGRHVRIEFQVRTHAPMLEGACALLLQCVRMGVSFGLQAFLHDLFVPRALFSHFRSDPSLLKPEMLEQTNQGIERKGRRVNT